MKLKLRGGSKSKIKTVIYFDQEILKIACSRSNSDHLMALAIYSIRDLSDDAIASQIQKTLKIVRGSSGHVILSLPRQFVTIKNLELPSQNSEEIASMVDFQVTRLVPHPRAEIIYDFQLLGMMPNQCSHVRVVVLHRKSI